MNNISIAKETIKIIRKGYYSIGDKKIMLRGSNFDEVIVYSPDKGKELLEKEIRGDRQCRITVTSEDSFQAAGRYDKPFVLNFANAHHAGGGFLLGANAQEEALCRCSTLYASINSKAASEMYRYNNTHMSRVESDHMLYSPNVCVFRDHKCELFEEQFLVSVVTASAPNRYGAALIASDSLISETITRRIRIMLKIAQEHGHRNLILGAWGCGAFGNDPKDVSECFRRVLIDEGYGKMFDEVCFAIYGKEDGRNYREFCGTFGTV